MNKDKKKTVKPEGKIKHMLRTNYWLTPLLLVALVFAIVFGVSKIPDLSNTIQGWFTKNEKCDECTSASYKDVYDKIKLNTEDKDIYVIFVENDNETCKELFPVLDKYLETNADRLNITIYSIDLTKKDNKYKDKTINQDAIDVLNGKLNDKQLPEVAPATIIRYTGTEIDAAKTGVLSYNTIKDFFEKAE